MKKLGKLLRNLLIICGVLFIIALFLPDEEEKPADFSNADSFFNLPDADDEDDEDDQLVR